MFLDEFAPSAQDETPASRRLDFISVSRRGFLAGATATAFTVGMVLRSGAAIAQEVVAGTDSVTGGPVSPSLFISIEPDGTVKLTCHRSEMGQQIWTAMAQILADELEADIERVEIVQAVGDAKYGDQNTDGSRSVRRNLQRLRLVGAAMRNMLEAAGAARWGVDASQVRSELGEVIHTGNGERLGYGELAEEAAALPVPAADAFELKPRAEWRYIGKPQPSLTVPKIVRGEGVFGQDVQLPDMLYAVIARPPRVFAALDSVDDAAALKVGGVTRTITLDTAEPPALFKPQGGVAVLASNTWAAMKGRDALKLGWSDGPNAGFSSAAYRESLEATAAEKGNVRMQRGDVYGTLENAAQRVSADYYVPHLPHASMEPPAATARWSEDGKVEVWACVQAPQATRQTVADTCGIPLEDVTINVTWLGGAFGRKSKPDFAAEAALIARKAGQPVKVIWTREDDLQHDYYHAVSAQHMEGALDEDGKCTAFLHRTVFPPIPTTFGGPNEPSWGELQQGATDNPFAVDNFQLETGSAAPGLRIGWLRSVANIYHAFAVQSFAAELAAAAGRDQKDFLLELIGPPRQIDPATDGAEYGNYGDPLDVYPIDTGRLSNVVEIAAEMAGWGREMPKGRGLGIAAHRSFLSYVATVVEVEIDEDGQMSIPGVWAAMDAGTVVNPRHARAQVEGGTLFGFSNALYGEISAERGAVTQRNFPDFRLMRINEAPREFEVHIVESDAPPGGVGEPPTPPAAPALINAIFAASGQRIRSLPVFGPRGRSLNAAA